ncbi:hypothetical protein AB9F45_27665 [Rhizobium leguminosarum]|uniref:hypothetical protein n=1 Tax=Rhizobium leguminosarum TaxID=384 RepID=UPI000FEFCB1E|nr:hypothetical protein [Rhizobium leguminosarum]RWY67872.1 hypothetical protein EHI46_26265 [Rhizobium leguminosarum]
MRQTELTPVQKATAYRLFNANQVLLKQLISNERAIYGGLFDTPAILNTAAIMFEGLADEVTINMMVRNSVLSLNQKLEKELQKKKPGRPTKEWWKENERETILMKLASGGTQDSAVEDFKARFREDILHFPVHFNKDRRATTLAEQLHISDKRESENRRKKRLKAFGDAMNESIRKHIVTLNKKRRQSLQQIEEDRLLDDFDEQ